MRTIEDPRSTTCPEWCACLEGHDADNIGRFHGRCVGAVTLSENRTRGIGIYLIQHEIMSNAEDEHIGLQGPPKLELKHGSSDWLTADEARQLADELYVAANELDRVTAAG